MTTAPDPTAPDPSATPDPGAVITADDVLRFWFEECGADDWFAGTPEFDARVRERLGAAQTAAAAVALDDWQRTPLGCVALCLLLDQAPRHLFRGTAGAFATDSKALAVAQSAVARGFDQAPDLTAGHRLFLYLPFEHSEALDDQHRCVALMRERIGDARIVDYAERHRDIIARFGRFPHRNAALGRDCTPEEAEFLTQPGSSF